MSATLSPASSAAVDGIGAPVHAIEAPKPLIEEKTLKIQMSAEPCNDIKYVLNPLFGDPPLEAPFRSRLALHNWDVRTLDAMTVRYTSEKGQKSALSPSAYNKIRPAIWRALYQLATPSTLANITLCPSIVFEGQTQHGDGRPQTISLVGLPEDLLNAVLRDVHKLEIENDDGGKMVYELSGHTNNLPGRIIGIDCHGILIKDAHAQAIGEAFKTITAPIGELLGVVAVALDSELWNLTKHQCGHTRAYVRLHERSITLPFDDYVRLFPTHLKWRGVPFNLSYCGRKLHTHNDFSRNFTPSGEDEPEVTTFNTKRNVATTDGEASGSAAKKQRRSEE